MFFSPDLQSNINVIVVEAPDKTIESMTQDQFQAAMELTYPIQMFSLFSRWKLTDERTPCGIHRDHIFSLRPSDPVLADLRQSQLYHYTHGPGFDGYRFSLDESMQTFKEAA